MLSLHYAWGTAVIHTIKYTAKFNLVHPQNLQVIHTTYLFESYYTVYV